MPLHRVEAKKGRARGDAHHKTSCLNLCMRGIEKSVMEFTHADLGSYMAGKWNLPEEICDAISNHHNETALKGDNLGAIIHLSDYLAHQTDITDDKGVENNNPFYESAWTALGLDNSSADKLINMLREEYSKAETFLKMAQGMS